MNNPWDWFEHRRMGRNREGVQELNAATLRDVRDEILSAQADNILISSEYLAQLQKKKIFDLRNYLQDLGDVTVVYYCRELISWISSDSQQCAKVGMKTEPTRYDVAIKRLYDFPLNYLEVFGRERFNLIRFEDAIQPGLCNSLLSQGGLPSIESMGITESPENTSISAEAANAFFILNKIHPLFGNTRSSKTTQILKAMPGQRYRINHLTKTEAADCNKKMRLLRRKYKFPMYDKVRPGTPEVTQRIYDDVSIEYLLDHLNNANLKNTELFEKIRNLENLASSALEEAKPTEAQEDLAVAIGLYREALKLIAGMCLPDFEA